MTDVACRPCQPELEDRAPGPCLPDGQPELPDPLA